MNAQIQVLMPPRWTVRRAPSAQVVVEAHPARSGRAGHTPHIVVRSHPVDAIDLDSWRAAALRELADGVVDLAIEDEDWYSIADLPAHYLRFAHRVGDADLLCDQWAWWVDGVGVTLTCSVRRDDYLTYCDIFEGVAETIRIELDALPADDSGDPVPLSALAG